jgi:hypothetical protein
LLNGLEGTNLARPSLVFRNTVIIRRFANNKSEPSKKGDVIDLLSRGKGNDNTTQTRFKFGSSELKLENLSEFSSEEKLMEVDTVRPDEVVQEEDIHHNPNSELYMTGILFTLYYYFTFIIFSRSRICREVIEYTKDYMACST